MQRQASKLLEKELENCSLVWRAGQNCQPKPVCTSAYPELDRVLNGGFPKQGVIEIRTLLGVGELRLISPYLQQKQSQGLIVFIGAPANLSSESLLLQGLNLTNILILSANSDEALWCAEQCLTSGCCASMVLWHNNFEIHQIRRLNLACEQAETSLFVFRDLYASNLGFSTELSLTLTPHQQGLSAKVEKQKGGRPSGEFIIDMHKYFPDLIVPETTSFLQQVTVNQSY